MEFKSLTNIESSFRRIRLMLAVFVGCCTLVTVFACGTHTALLRNSVRKFMYSMAASH